MPPAEVEVRPRHRTGRITDGASVRAMPKGAARVYIQREEGVGEEEEMYVLF